MLDAQATGVSSFMSHMDAAEGRGYAKNSGVLVSRWIYDLMPNNDIRKQKWFTAPTMDWRVVTQAQMDEMGVGTRQVYLKYWESQQMI